MGGSVDSDLAFFHGLQQGGLRAWRHTVDLVSQQHVGEERPAMQRERAGGKVEHIAADNVGRHEIRSALDAAKFQMEEPSKTLDDERLRNTRYTFQQGMAPAQQGE